MLIITSVPFALVGGIWVPLLDGVPFVGSHRDRLYRPAGVAAEFGVVMLMYLRHAIEAEPSLENPQTFSVDKLDEALYRGGAARAAEGDDRGGDYRRPVADFMGHRRRVGGDEPHRRADDWRDDHRPLLSLFIIPAAYKLMWLSRHRGKRSE